LLVFECAAFVLVAVVVFAGLAVPLTLVATVVLVAPVAPLTEVVVVVLVVVFAFEAAELVLATTAVFALFALAAVLVFAASPQAMPSAPSARTLESAITFFIEIDSPVFLKGYLTYFYVKTASFSQSCP
jgi:hypothetical protein